MLCSFISPAIVQRGDLSIAISTGGRCPGFAKRVRRKIEASEASIDTGYGTALAAIAAKRREAMIRDWFKDEAERRRCLDEIVESAWKELDPSE